jgi:hypothetical protein
MLSNDEALNEFCDKEKFQYSVAPKTFKAPPRNFKQYSSGPSYVTAALISS